eukprot:TRINITY_DN10916_c0_g1_i4.p1 TRINITY_DN10916_c0_g1~~TRINITY_DN10916_c0_g1_i4.p1  ORF type:complete len:160 (-),score=13.53 TRINITY_DN10916_c0_g1_i4:224-703(-)
MRGYGRSLEQRLTVVWAWSGTVGWWLLRNVLSWSSQRTIVVGSGVEDELMVGLSLHAGLCEAVDHVGDEVDELSQVSQVTNKDGGNMTNAGEQLHEVVEANNAVVTWICLNLALVLHVDARGADGAILAAKRLQIDSVDEWKAGCLKPGRLRIKPVQRR